MDVKTLRLKTGLSQSQFAHTLGIPVKTIQSWESGLRKPPEYILKFIEKVLKYEGLFKPE